MAPQIETQFNSHGAAAECIARIGTWHWRAGEDACHWSAGMYGLFGWQIARGARRMPGFEKALTPESWQRLQALAARCGSDGEPFEFVAEVRAGLPARWVSIRGGALRDPHGAVIGLAGAVHDVTQQQAGRALHDSEVRCASVFHTSLVAVGISRASDGRFVAVNDGFLHAVGYVRDEVVGKTALELGLWQDPAERTRLMELIEASEEGVTSYPACIRRKSGEVGEVLLSARLVMLGGERCVVTILTDVSGRTRIVQALRASEERYRAVVEDQTESIVRFRIDGTLTFANDVYCRTFGKSAEDMVGKRWQPVVHPDDVPMIEARLRTLSPANNVVTIENRVRAADGRVRWMQFVNRAFFDQQGHITEMQAVGRDITERKEIESALQAANEHLERRVAERTVALRQLAYDATLAEERERRAIARDLHDDLGQLLHVAKIRLGQLSKCDLDAGAQALLAGLDQLCTRANARVRSLTAQLSPPALERLGLVPSLSWLADEMAQSYGLHVETADDGRDKPLSPAHSAILFRAARELLINVAKHARSAGATIATRRDGDCIELRVADGGVGIADPAGALYGGRTFGLPSVRERIEFLGGSLHLESRQGTGATVTLRLPLAAEEVR